MNPADTAQAHAQQALTPDAARTRLLALINASWTTQALAAAAQIRLPERLTANALSAQELAASCGCEVGALTRLLRALATLGVAQEGPDGRFAIGPLGAHLRSEGPGTLGAWAEFCGTASWQAWHRLADCVRAGLTVRQLEGGAAGLRHLDEDQASAVLFHRAMASLSRAVAQSLAHQLRFDDGACVVDVGGSSGELLSVLLLAHSSLRGIVFDRPHAGAAARGALQQAGLAGRCEFAPGDFFDCVSAGGSVYLLKSILHNWDDASATVILQRCRQAMAPRARVAVIERLLPERMTGSSKHRAMARSDLNMLVGPGGKERTEAAYRQLLAQAGLRTLRTTALVDGYSVVEAQAER